MNTPTMTIRLPREYIDSLEAEVAAGKYETRSGAAVEIIKRHYDRKRKKAAPKP